MWRICSIKNYIIRWEFLNKLLSVNNTINNNSVGNTANNNSVANTANSVDNTVNDNSVSSVDSNSVNNT